MLDGCSASVAGGQIEEIEGKSIEIGENSSGRNHVGVFGVHVAEAHGVAGLTTIEAAFLRQGHTIVEAERVDYGGAHAARGRRPDDDDAVAAEECQIGGEVRPEATASAF